MPERARQVAGARVFLGVVTAFQPILHLAANAQSPDRFDPWEGRAAMTALTGLCWLATHRLELARRRARDVAWAAALSLQVYLLGIAAPNHMNPEYFVGLVMTTAVMLTWCRTAPQLAVFGVLTLGGAALGNELSTDRTFETPTVLAVLSALMVAVGLTLVQRSRLEQQVSDQAAELADALEEVRRLDQAKSRVLHDLANVASSLVGCCDEIEALSPRVEGTLAPAAAKALAEEVHGLRRAVDYVVTLHTKVRGLHVTEQGPETLALAPALESALAVARSGLPANTALTLDCDPGRRAMVDPTALGRILVNLLVNAGHAMEEAEVTAPTLRLEVRERSDYVQIRVMDNGPGVPVTLHQRIFEPRFTTREDAGGTGLGLAICRELAGENGGTLELDATYTGGAAFVLTLPSGLRRAEPWPLRETA